MMPRLLLLVCSILSLSFLSVAANQAANTASVGADDHAIIQRRRVVLIRPARLAKQFPYKKKAVVTYPLISGLSPVIQRRVNSLLSFKNIFDSSLKEYREDAWLETFTYQVIHNGDHLLDINFFQEGSGAYPDSQNKNILIDLRNGSLIKPDDAFQSAKFPELAAAIDRKLQAELKRIDKEAQENNSEQPEERAMRREAYEPLKFKVEDLDEFSVNRKGVTFIYDAGFPHVIQALEPDGHYFFSYAELRGFIKPNGPLGQFVR